MGKVSKETEVQPRWEIDRQDLGLSAETFYHRTTFQRYELTFQAFAVHRSEKFKLPAPQLINPNSVLAKS